MRKRIWMIQAWLAMIAVGGLCSCSSVSIPGLTTPDNICRIAGSSEDEINSLRALIENARDAGAVEVDVLSDAGIACDVCLDPDVDCDATLCESCFGAIVIEVFGEQ